MRKSLGKNLSVEKGQGVDSGLSGVTFRGDMRCWEREEDALDSLLRETDLSSL